MMIGNKAWILLTTVSLFFTGCANTEKNEGKRQNVTSSEEHKITTFNGSLETMIGPSEEVAYVKIFPFILYKVYPVEGIGSFYIDNRVDIIKNELRAGKVWED